MDKTNTTSIGSLAEAVSQAVKSALSGGPGATGNFDLSRALASFRLAVPAFQGARDIHTPDEWMHNAKTYLALYAPAREELEHVVLMLDRLSAEDAANLRAEHAYSLAAVEEHPSRTYPKRLWLQRVERELEAQTLCAGKPPAQARVVASKAFDRLGLTTPAAQRILMHLVVCYRRDFNAACKPVPRVADTIAVKFDGALQAIIEAAEDAQEYLREQELYTPLVRRMEASLGVTATSTAIAATTTTTASTTTTATTGSDTTRSDSVFASPSRTLPSLTNDSNDRLSKQLQKRRKHKEKWRVLEVENARLKGQLESLKGKGGT